MIRFFSTSSLTRLVETVAVIEHSFNVSAPDLEDDLDQQLVHRLGDASKHLGVIAEKLEASGLQSRAEKFQARLMAGDFPVEHIRYEAREIMAALKSELDGVLFLVVESKDRAYFEDRLLSETAASAFPTADEELLEAGKCFALGRFTASVYHGMCALEPGLEALRAYVPVKKVKNESWGPTLNRIEAAIKDALRKKPTPKRQFLAESAASFRFYKDAWRNHVMHARHTYDRERAERILSHVVHFIEHLATRLKQR